jgi:hypothetical protein
MGLRLARNAAALPMFAVNADLSALIIRGQAESRLRYLDRNTRAHARKNPNITDTATTGPVR